MNEHVLSQNPQSYFHLFLSNVFSQAGAFQPFFRAHAEFHTDRREPWLFDDVYKNLIREAICARYALLPYWYTLFFETAVTGTPVVR